MCFIKRKKGLTKYRHAAKDHYLEYKTSNKKPPCAAATIPDHQAVSGRSEVQIDFHIFIFPIKFMFLIKNLFNVIKFELKIYALNNVIKIFFIFFVGSCRVGLIRPTIGPSWARPNGSCRAWHVRPEARPGHGPVWASSWHEPLSFVPDQFHRASGRPI
jgi:hypothetical protein